MKRSLTLIARELFYRNGYSRTRILDITKKRGVSPANFYHYFNSKEEVLRKVIKNESEEYLNRLKKISEIHDGVLDKISNILDINMTLIFDKPDFIILLEELKLERISGKTEIMIKNIKEANKLVLNEILDGTNLDYQDKLLACQLISTTITTFYNSILWDCDGNCCLEKIHFINKEKKVNELTQVVIHMCKGLNIPNDIMMKDLETNLYTKKYFKELLGVLIKKCEINNTYLYMIYMEIPVIKVLREKKNFFFESFMKSTGKTFANILRFRDIKARVGDTSFIFALVDYKKSSFEMTLKRFEDNKIKLYKQYSIKEDYPIILSLLKIPELQKIDIDAIIENKAERDKYLIRESCI